VSTWVFGIARFRALDLLRKEKRGARIPEPVLVEPDPAPAVEDRERTLRAIKSLPEGQREVVFLTFYEGLSYGEIAGILGIPEGTVKSRMHYARRALAEALA
jgi:RNA polymerase sigma-70 factor (ECF subfamily)